MKKLMPKSKVRRMVGTIVGASDVKRVVTQKGNTQESATIHIQEDVNDPNSAQLAINVSGELSNYARCLGAQVAIDYTIRVFPFDRNGKRQIGNDIYAVGVMRVDR